MVGALFLSTSGLNSFLSQDSWVRVSSGPGTVRKLAKDLNVGDIVVAENQYINKSLEEIDVALEDSLRYRMAKEELHAKNSKGRNIKKFRVMLWSGFLGEKAKSLESKILLEEEDFSNALYSEFESLLMDYVDVKEDAVRKWLKGDTHSPDNWSTFGRLAEINPEFKAIDNSFGKDNGYHASYQLYVGLRRYIRAYLSMRKLQGSGKPFKFSGTGKYSTEVEMIVKKFFQEIDSKHDGVRIIDLKQVKPASGKQSAAGNNKEVHLSRGIFIDNGTVDLGKPTIPMKQIVDENYIVGVAHYDGLLAYIQKKCASENISSIGYFHNFMQSYFAMKLMPKSSYSRTAFEFNMEILFRPNRKYSRETLMFAMEDSYKKFYEHLADGKVDSIFGLPPNTFANLTDIMISLHAVLPKAYYSLKSIDLQLKIQKYNFDHAANKKERVAARVNIDGLKQKITGYESYLMQNYSIGFDSRQLLFTYYKQAGSLKPYSHIEQVSKADLLSFKASCEADGLTFFTYRQCSEVLESLGIGAVISLIGKRNFPI